LFSDPHKINSVRAERRHFDVKPGGTQISHWDLRTASRDNLSLQGRSMAVNKTYSRLRYHIEMDVSFMLRSP